MFEHVHISTLWDSRSPLWPFSLSSSVPPPPTPSSAGPPTPHESVAADKRRNNILRTYIGIHM